MSYISNRWNFRKLKRRRREIREEYAKKTTNIALDKSKTSAIMPLYKQGILRRESHRGGGEQFISIRFFEQATEHDVEIPQPSDHS